MKYQTAAEWREQLARQLEWEARSVHLQRVGRVPAIPARDVKVGMVRLYNWGGTGTIENIEPTKTGNGLVFSIRASDGKLYTRRVRPDTLVPIRGLNA